MANLTNTRRGPFASLASATSANGTARNGAGIDSGNMVPGSLSFYCSTTIVTGSVVATWKVQVSDDNVTFYDLKLLNNPAAVTVTATGDIVLVVPHSAHAWKWVRIQGTLSGAATAAGDLTLSNYRSLALSTLTR